ncbi:CRISPR-associated helicase Cas3' [Cronobacter dublinensis]|nr:CRISPR-associated helicase Cas3' [Cronobacter dublinensis]EKF2294294.1 CRISPR-associated helicase Cas3' [Cronobacter dublinensis]EKF2298305.1 CRISPR-associated helicase Cas3' [Cronobacter dublinensis]EKK5266964.1 CRISPR-associated helicase Cas3' [Cronobacter dublinensis]EKM0139264.1 CRISPR-associated helicase Cas3' [Cronobacter dublinensis]
MNSLWYWGKARQGENHQGDEYHLLQWHSLDVAACGYVMVMENRFNAASLFAALGIHERETAATFFAWLLCWHDIGKFSRLFQQKYCHEALDHGQRDVSDSHHHHTVTGTWLWRHHLGDTAAQSVTGPLSARERKRVLDRWIPTVMGHHGKPVSYENCHNDFLAEDIEAAQAFARAVQTLFPVVTLPQAWNDASWRESFLPQSWLVSALVVLADWVGSGNHFFPWVAGEMPLANYWVRAVEQAQNALRLLPPASDVAPFKGIDTLFPFITAPTPLQQHALELTINMSGPHLFILEDVTGAGKTEAALVLAHRLMAAGQARGLYIGLPTMATANAMYARMERAWLRLYREGSHPSLVLAHSARKLSASFNASLWASELLPNESGDEASAFEGCAAWFAGSPKKALLAETGVGTLDQAMMAVMAFKHQNLRLLGLNDKVLIADEIHSYDAYMSHVVEKLVETRARYGNATILLSATLSQAQRDRLIAAFYKGLNTTRESPRLGPDDYPWVTHLHAQGIDGQRVATRAQVQRRVGIGWMADEAACLDKIERVAREGGCIGWIRNSVDDAVNSYRELIRRGNIPEENIILFHSRFAFIDRNKKEEATLEWFGKENAVNRSGKIIISTQVIEQSIDIDLDYLISDLAPIDLLIQRAGRMQRHIRDKDGRLKFTGADERPAPCLDILAPPWQAQPDKTWLSAAMRNTSYVYPAHSRLWLTQRVLREQGEIRMPEAARLLIEAVYGEEIDVPEGMKRSEDAALADYYSQRAIASKYEISLNVGYSVESAELWGSDVSTRIGELTIDLWLARETPQGITPYAQGDNAWEMSALRVRKSWWDKHRGEFTLLCGEALSQWCSAQRKPEAVVILLPGGYSAKEGLIGEA